MSTESSQEMTTTVAANNFNDLLCYIEPENTLLSLTIQTATQEIMPNVKTGHEHEFPDLRKLHDEIARKSYARREMEIKRMWNDSKNLKSIFEEKKKDLEMAKRNGMLYEIRSIELQLQLNKLQAERKDFVEKDRDSKEIDRLKTLLDNAQKLHEERTLILQELYDQNEARIRANREIYREIATIAKRLRKERDESLESDKDR
ncbi:lamin-C-like [Polyergus mexicanus]|uniref:lamin-C-like n=1 Tax=Polyergus mexicanus TaxID=615972 RepID=UPI0038B5B838